MRIVSVVACVAFFAGTGSALAADCNKGMLWPFVRTAGDCLTDGEIAAGQRGVYSGPVNTNVDVGAIKPSEVPAQSAGVSGGTGLTGSSSDGGALIPTSVFGGQPKGIVDTDANCTKGVTWPFVRSPGDCLTADEKKAGKTGVFGGGPGVAPAGTTTATLPNGGQPQTAQPTAAPSPAAPSCERSWFWPFVRESNDCPTAADKKAGRTSALGGAPVVTQASVTTPAAPPAAPNAAVATNMPAVQTAPAAAASAASAPSCQKGWLWPFVRESGDCATEQEKKNAKDK